MARFTASIDDQLKDQLDTFAEEHDYNRSEALELMIRTFFEGKADTPQPTPPPTAEEAPAQPQPSQSDSTRLDRLEERLEQLQAQLGESSPLNVRMDLLEMQKRMNQMESYLMLQNVYVADLHQVVVTNVNANVEGFTALETPVEFFVPSTDPPALDLAE